MLGVEPLTCEAELQAFYAEQGMSFWCPAMFRVGHAFGVRGPSGELISAGSVNFAIPEVGYAQVGPVVTHPGYRNRGHATRVLTAIRSSLARSGVRACGLFADADNPRLPEFYGRQGFTARGRFRFVTPPLPLGSA